MQIKDVNLNEDIYQEGDQQKYLFIIIRGKVKFV